MAERASKVIVVGAGVSGLTVARELLLRGFAVEIYEKRQGCGGLLGSQMSELGLVESAANAIRATKNVEKLCRDLGLPMAERLRSAKTRWVYFQKPRQAPLQGLAVHQLWALAKLVVSILFRLPWAKPRLRESVTDWLRRVGAASLQDCLVEPALNGIYAGDLNALSADLIFARFWRPAPKRGQWRGSVSPLGGMGALVEALQADILKRGARIHFDQEFNFQTSQPAPVIIATSAWSAAEIVKDKYPAVASYLRKAEALPLISVTAFFDGEESDLQGFGCVFPRTEEFNSLGVLFNSSVFSGRVRNPSEKSQIRSETWILGGAHRRELETMSSESIQSNVVAEILEDRRRLYGQTGDPLEVHVSSWPRAIPHFTVEWAETLAKLKQELGHLPQIFLHGNYMGDLGLAGLVEQSVRLAESLEVQSA